MKTLILYSSVTGNTQKIANAVFEAIPFEKDIYKIGSNFDLRQYDLIAVGYWVNKGNCDDKIKQIIEKLDNKNVIFFGTLGAKDRGNYYENIKRKVEQLLPSNNKLLGHFLCQGKITEKLTEKYKEMLKKNPNDEHIKEQLKNHKEAFSHPNDMDVEKTKKFIQNIIKTSLD